MIGNTTGAKTAFQDKGTYYELSAAAAPSPTAVTLRATKHPALTFAMYAGSTLLWKEAAPISWKLHEGAPGRYVYRPPHPAEHGPLSGSWSGGLGQHVFNS